MRELCIFIVGMLVMYLLILANREKKELWRKQGYQPIGIKQPPNSRPRTPPPLSGGSSVMKPAPPPTRISKYYP